METFPTGHNTAVFRWYQCYYKPLKNEYIATISNVITTSLTNRSLLRDAPLALTLSIDIARSSICSRSFQISPSLSSLSLAQPLAGPTRENAGRSNNGYSPFSRNQIVLNGHNWREVSSLYCLTSAAFEHCTDITLNFLALSI